jgi:trehalose utilization protein
MAAAPLWGKKPVRVLVWSERTEPSEIYPDGINGAIAAMLNQEKDIRATASSLQDADQGLGEELLAAADVLIDFGHRYHRVVSEENAGRIVRNVELNGMGYLPLHSSSGARAFQTILSRLAERQSKPLDGVPGRWAGVRNEGLPCSVHVLEPKHPIAKGVVDFVVPKCEDYLEPLLAPPPDLKIFDGNQGLLWRFGRGKVFYLQQGHETYPVYFQPEIQRVLRNAVRFLASGL